MTIVVPSKWLEDHLRSSFLQEYPVRVIPNGVNLSVFNPEKHNTVRERYDLKGRRIILGVANIWKKRKALDDFVALSSMINKNDRILLAGMRNTHKAGIPSNIIPVEHTRDIDDLVSLYVTSDVFVNPTYADNFPTTNIESLACGTPVITYKTGGSQESIDELTGKVVERGNIIALKNAIDEVIERGKESYLTPCRIRAERFYDQNTQYASYLELFKKRNEVTGT